MTTAEPLFWLIGALLITFAVLVGRDRTNPRRLTSAAFWGLTGAGFIRGSWVAAKAAPAWILGVAVLVIAVLGMSKRTLAAGVGATTGPAEREASAVRFGNTLFIPALCIPIVAGVVTFVGPLLTIGGTPLIASSVATLIGLGLGAIVALVVGYLLLHPRPVTAPLQEGRRLLETIGWAAILPQMLAILGVLFTQAGVGKAVGTLISSVVPEGVLIAGVITYCVGMALFTILLGNAFAAFPIMTAAIGWPLLVQLDHGNPAAVFAIGMLAGFCGTLCTPMAANFNVVPAALLEMRNRYGVITAQLPTAGMMLVANILLMYLFAFPT